MPIELIFTSQLIDYVMNLIGDAVRSHLNVYVPEVRQTLETPTSEPQLSQMDVLVEFVVSSARTLKSCGGSQCSMFEIRTYK